MGTSAWVKKSIIIVARNAYYSMMGSVTTLRNNRPYLPGFVVGKRLKNNFPLLDLGDGL
jgi:hypothetical protein